MALERITISLPAGFDPGRHIKALEKLIADKHGDGFEIDHIDPVGLTATASRQAAITEVTAQPGGSGKPSTSFEVKLPRGTKPSDGDKMAAKFEDQYPGGYLTKFEPYLGTAIISKLTVAEARCRGAVAVALGVKPWDVQVRARRDGGFDLELPKTYVPSKHDDKLDEVATSIIGQDGWYVDTNAAKLTASILPGEPPTFPGVMRYPFDQLGRTGDEELLLGRALPERADKDAADVFIDFGAGPHIQLSGTSGSGKAQPLTSRIPVPVSDRFPNGWATVGELRSGDEVYSADGRTTTIHGLTPIVEEPIYEVEFDDGQTVRVTGAHLWTVSSAAARHVHNRNESSNAIIVERRTSQAEALRKVARSYAADASASLSQLAEIAGIGYGYALSLARSAGLRSEHVEASVHSESATVTSNIAVKHFLADDALLIMSGQPVRPDNPVFGRWLSARDLTRFTHNGMEPTRAQVKRTYRILQSAGVSQKTLRVSVTRAAGRGLRTIEVFPVGEFLYAAAAARDGLVQPGASGSLMPLQQTVNTLTIRDSLLTKDSRREHNWAVRVAEPFDSPDKELAVPPYVLGVWLGDGHSYGGQITQGITESCTDEHGLTDQAFVVEQLVQEGVAASPSSSLERVINTQGLRAALREIGVLANKHIPAQYLRASKRQRLALLQGLMDTDGSVDVNGSSELSLCDHRLIIDALELVRSLGIKAHLTSGDATITEEDPDSPGHRRRRVVGTRWRINFTDTQQVFRLPRKAQRIKSETRKTQRWLYVTSVRQLDSEPARCLHINHPESLYLTDGFIPTHNSVALHSMIAGALASGHSLVVVDLPFKAVDFVEFREFCRPGGWGCAAPTTTIDEWLPEALAALGMVYDEGMRRAGLLAEHNVTKVGDLPKSVRVSPIFVVCDEVTGILQLDEVPKGVPKDHPMVVEANYKNLMRQMILGYMKRIAAELRFAGIRMVLSSQVSSVNTGVPTSLRLNLSQKILLGPNPTEGNRKLSLSDPTSVPSVPENVKADGKASKGVGVAELDGQPNVVFKSFFATPTEYVKRLVGLGVPITSRPRPTKREIDKYTPSLDDADSAPAGTAANDYGYDAGPTIDPNTGEVLTGFAKANEARRQLDAAAGTASKKKPQMPAAGPVAVTQAEICPSCNKPISPSSGECGCSR